VAYEWDQVSGRSADAVAQALVAQARRIAQEQGPEQAAAQLLATRLAAGREPTR